MQNVVNLANNDKDDACYCIQNQIVLLLRLGSGRAGQGAETGAVGAA